MAIITIIVIYQKWVGATAENNVGLTIKMKVDENGSFTLYHAILGCFGQMMVDWKQTSDAGIENKQDLTPSGKS